MVKKNSQSQGNLEWNQEWNLERNQSQKGIYPLLGNCRYWHYKSFQHTGAGVKANSQWGTGVWRWESNMNLTEYADVPRMASSRMKGGGGILNMAWGLFSTLERSEVWTCSAHGKKCDYYSAWSWQKVLRNRPISWLALSTCLLVWG